MQNTAIAYVGGHSHQLLLYIIEYAISHGRKQQFQGRKIKYVHTDLEFTIWSKKSMTKGPTCLQLPQCTHLPLCGGPLGREGEQRTALRGYTQVL